MDFLPSYDQIGHNITRSMIYCVDHFDCKIDIDVHRLRL